MSKLKDLTGKKFGRLTALYRLRNYPSKSAYWLCVCECGNFKEVRGNHLRNGNIKSCGCLNSELVKSRMTKHGKHNTKLYNIFNAMKERCYNKNNERYKDYGDRNIQICDEWLNDFQAFYDWSMNNNYREGLTIDRIDVNGNYAPDNCRWADQKTQQNNRRNTIYLTYNNKKLTISQWSELLCVPKGRLRNRYNRGWSIKEILFGREK